VISRYVEQRCGKREIGKIGYAVALQVGENPMSAVYIKRLLPCHNHRFYLDVSVSIRDLHQKKLVQFFLRFLPR